ncbi:hypothetical protein LKL35_14645 [Streptomyces sp. ET3-23]|uniref:membrane protein YczE n=1 Tax=Streptomyces sp. ET3-23 TaxID=2885643 RepID=UPI001D10C6B3|nr:hypothetical protein [Streptomyces sp. ET3-23]MCC2276637.1 hypothetical protein [Streptomyces sp. ET3-23]
MSASGGSHLARRLVQLYGGLTLYGISCALQLRAGLGLAPWDVLNQGIARHSGLSVGTATILVGVAVLLLWIPLRQRPGLGTVSNVLLIGLVMDATLSLVPAPGSLWVRVPLLLFSVVLCALATGLYITPRFGPGPRDGLMTGLHRRTGRSVRLVRTCIEIVVLATGYLLGGTVGVGTVLFAAAIGPLSQLFLRLFAPRPEVRGEPVASGTGALVQAPEMRTGSVRL